MRKIVNLTQHSSTPEQRAHGVVDLEGKEREELLELLTFNELPTQSEVRERAERIADLTSTHGCEAAMIGGAPYLMGPLEAALRERGITPLYAFTKRESVEEVQPDGSVRKTAVFRHAGFIEGAL